MTIFKCKMCGGTLEITEGSSVCTCEFCDTVQTLPTIQDEGLQNLFNRANVLRIKSEFDKAAEIYEKILQKNSEESEAYWGLILCKYGIEYVEDPDTYKRIPTCHRASFDSVIADDDYKMALQYADMSQKAIYEEEARVIDEVQKGIIALAQKADPYDVFICYKETDENGQRTQDSVIANDIYYQLTQEGFKVFYAAITLEDKLGFEYEPYIFSALNTAKVLLSIGTKPEYFNAVWVKNEWSRFLKIMKKDRSKMLIPCYKDMDAYELPEEFAHLQAQNMGKIGFINDLVRGIKKVIVKEEVNKPSIGTPVVQTTYSSNVQALLDRGHMALEDLEWDKADGFYEEVLNQDAKCADAYLGKLLAANRVNSIDKYFSKLESKYSSATSEKLYACKEETAHINLVVKENVLDGYLDSDKIKKLYVFDRSYSSNLSCRKEQKRKQQTEIDSDKLLARVRQYATGELKEQIEAGLEELISVHDARIIEEQKADEAQITEITVKYHKHIEDADRKARDMRVKADKAKYSDYETLVGKMKKASTLSDYGSVLSKFKELGTYEESFELAKKCQSEIDRIKDEERKEKEQLARKKKKITIISLGIVVLIIIVVAIVTKIIIPNQKYNEAVELMNNTKYQEAITAFENLDGYKDSEIKIELCQTAILDQRYDSALANYNSGNYERAITVFTSLNGYRDSNEQIELCETAILDCEYNSALELYNSGDYEQAITEFTSLNGYRDSNEQIELCETAILDCEYNSALELYNSGDYEQAITEFTLLNGYRDSEELIASSEVAILSDLEVGDSFYYGVYEDQPIEWLVLDIQDNHVLVITKNILCARTYHSSWTDVTWSSCTLRRWLNGEFYSQSFSSSERNNIITTTVTADPNLEYGTYQGSDTQDNVFLLSLSEADRYFESDSSRICRYDGTAVNWFLRTAGNIPKHVSVVTENGEISAWGDHVGSRTADDGRFFDETGYIRPAMWIEI